MAEDEESAKNKSEVVIAITNEDIVYWTAIMIIFSIGFLSGFALMGIICSCFICCSYKKRERHDHGMMMYPMQNTTTAV
jgi:hypothetical protein